MRSPEEAGSRRSVWTHRALAALAGGGDWALERLGAVLLEGTVGFTIANCTFTRLDGNAVFLSGYNRNATVAQSTFASLGQSAIAAWGETNDWDGTGGQQPRFTTVVGNLAYDVGLIQCVRHELGGWGVPTSPRSLLCIRHSMLRAGSSLRSTFRQRRARTR